jgi:calcium/calmodulin-dependent protein kinase I
MTDQRRFQDYYQMGRTLGDGNFAVVKVCTEKKTSKTWAVKCVKKTMLGEKDRQNLSQEMKVLKSLNHPRIVKLHDVFDSDPDMCYIVMELMSGGELFDRIIEKEQYTEAEAKNVVCTIAQVLEYCHDRGIAHRDLKPENLLYSSRDEDSVIKIADFGFAKDTKEATVMATMCGTPGYFAPEVIKRKPYELKCDIWSLGVITYILLCGFPPFYDENQAVEMQKIQNAEYDYPEPYFDEISDKALDLIDKMLVIDADKRLSAKQVLNHPWLAGADRTLTKDELSSMPKLSIGHTLQQNKGMIKKKIQKKCGGNINAQSNGKHGQGRETRMIAAIGLIIHAAVEDQKTLHI